MAVLTPVQPFLALVDRLISLVKTRQTRRRDYFEKIIDPLYTQFKPLAEDYLKLFRRLAKKLGDGRNEPPMPMNKLPTSMIRDIKKSREVFLDSRREIMALLTVCEEDSKKRKDKEVTELVNAMLGFFSPQFYHPSWATMLASELEEWNKEWDSTTVRHNAADTIDRIVNQLEHYWYEIAGRYMELKLKAHGE